MANRASAVELAVENDPVATAARVLPEEDDWERSTGELLPELEGLVSKKIGESRTWPRVPNALGTRLRRVAPALCQVGVEVELGGGATTKDRKRLVVIRRRGQADCPGRATGGPELPHTVKLMITTTTTIA